MIERLHTDHGENPAYFHFMSMLGTQWPKRRPYLRSLSSFGDSEGKTRTIGILDYWSQTVLKPIHDHLAAILNKIPEDCTFSQESFIKKLPVNRTYYSFDLTNATDRLPIEIQLDIISSIIGPERAKA